jgi:hypothetical protein
VKKDEDNRTIGYLLDLGNRALSEKNVDKMIALLQGREGFVQDLLLGAPLTGNDNLQECLKTETEILRRLEAEKRKLIVEIEALARKKKGVCRYSSRFPLPPMPVFLDIAG